MTTPDDAEWPLWSSSSKGKGTEEWWGDARTSFFLRRGGGGGLRDGGGGGGGKVIKKMNKDTFYKAARGGGGGGGAGGGDARAGHASDELLVEVVPPPNTSEPFVGAHPEDHQQERSASVLGGQKKEGKKAADESSGTRHSRCLQPQGACRRGCGFAWQTSEWSLEPDTLELLRYSKPFDVDDDGDTSLATAAAAADGGGGGGGFTTSSSWRGRGAQGEGEERFGRLRQKRGEGNVSVKRCCSARGCSSRVTLQPPSSCSSTTVALCALHQRVRTGVRVAHDVDLVRWCSRCKSAHTLSDFARHHRHHDTLLRKRGGGGGEDSNFLDSKKKLQRRRKSDDARLRLRHCFVSDAEADTVQRWTGVGEARNLEISVDAEPASLAASQQETTPVWNLVKRVATATAGDEVGDVYAAAPDDSEEANRDEEEVEEEEELLSSVACAMLPGSTRLMVSARTLRLGPCPSLLDIAASLPETGVMGRDVVTVSTFDEDPDYAHLARFSQDGKVDENLIGLAQGWSVTINTRLKHLLGQPTRLCPMPPGIKMCPIALTGQPFIISGFKGNERVHIFGQKMKPASITVSPRGGIVRFTVPLASPGSEPTVAPGYISVQVLAHGQPASATEFRRIFFVDDVDIRDELVALMRGAGVATDDDEAQLQEEEEQKRNGKEVEGDYDDDDEEEPRPFRRRTTEGFQDPAAFNRFIRDLGWLFEAHWRSRLYTASARRVARCIINAFRILVDAEDVPETTLLIEQIECDLDGQEEWEMDRQLPPEDESQGCPPADGDAALPAEAAEKKKLTLADPSGLARLPTLPVNGKPRATGAYDYAARAHTNFYNNNDDSGGGLGGGFCGGLNADDELSDVLFPPSAERWIFFHQAGGLITLFATLICIFKFQQWGLMASQTHVAKMQTLGLVYAVIMSLSTQVKPLQRILERLHAHGKSSTALWWTNRFDQFVIMLICSQNAFVTTTFPHDASVLQTKWIIATMCTICNMVFLGLFRAEEAPYKATRLDLPCQGFLIFAVFYGAQYYVHGHARFLTELAFSSFAHSALALFLVPLVLATCARQLYRREIRISHRLEAARKLRKLA